MSVAAAPDEPAVYRPFALLAFGATVLVGTPVGTWILAWLFWRAPAPGVESLLLHASVQVFGFFATLIVGVAHHLLPRFTGRPVRRYALTPWLLAALAVALGARLVAAALGLRAVLLGAALLHGAAFILFAVLVWRILDPPPLALLRLHLTASTGWLGVACLVEALARGRALVHDAAVPDGGAMRAAYALAIYGGVVGWIVGVLLRAGPMFVAGWSVPRALARAMPGIVGLGAVIAAAGEGVVAGPSGLGLARLGELVVLAAVAGTTLSAGALRRVRDALPLVSRSPEEARIFRLGVVAATVAALGSAVAVVLAWSGAPPLLVSDALRHLVTVGFIGAVVVAMAFRLIPVLERRALPWPRSRSVAFWTLLGGVVLRTAELFVGLGSRPLGAWLPLSGLLVWVAFACVAANLAGAVVLPRRADSLA